MAIKLFGFTLGKDKSLVKTEEKPKSFVLPEGDDGSVLVEAGGFYGQYIDLDGTSRNDLELILKYREMSMHPECDSAIEDIITEGIVCEDNQQPVKIVLDGTNFSDKIKTKIVEEFDQILRLLAFKTKGYEIFKRWYIDSRLVFHIIIDEKARKQGILELRYVDPINIQKIKEYKKETRPDGSKIITGVRHFYIYNKDGFRSGDATGLKISPDSICWVSSGLFDTRNKRICGFLHKAIKPLNQLRMMEDAVVIYRISRAPERRIFYVDVGNLPKNKSEQYLKDLMLRYKNRLTYDMNTGQIRDDRRHMSMLEDYWIPRREGGKGTEIDTLPGGQNLGQMQDVEYFLKRLYQSLNVPLSRISGEQKSFSIGKGTEITRDEIKFAKFISRLRAKFSELFFNLLRIQLILKGIITEKEWDLNKGEIYIDYLKESYFAEQKQFEILRDKIEILTTMEPAIGKYYSEKWVRKNILGLTDKDEEVLQKQIDAENKIKQEKEAQQLQLNPQKNQTQEEKKDNKKKSFNSFKKQIGKQEDNNG